MVQWSLVHERQGKYVGRGCPTMTVLRFMLGITYTFVFLPS